MTRPPIRIVVLYSCAILLIGVALYMFLVDDSERLARGLVPLTRPLNSGGMRGSFVAVWDEPDQVAVVFPSPSGVADVDSFCPAG